MDIRQVKQKFTSQLEIYFRDHPRSAIQEFQKHKQISLKCIPTLPQKILIQEREPEYDIVRSLDQFKYSPQTLIDTPPKKVAIESPKFKYEFDQIYGYCLNQTNFNILLDRLTLMRRTLHRKAQLNITLDQFISNTDLEQLCKWLPCNRADIISRLGDEAKQFADQLCKEIKYFMEQNNINKAEIHYEEDQINIDDAIFDFIESQHKQPNDIHLY